MAELLAHPDKDRDYSKSILHLRHGSIAITTRSGERLTDEIAVLLLEQARLIIVDQSLEG
jgi:hypothetical protein